MARIFHEMRAWSTVCVSFCVRTIHRFWNWYLSWYKSTRWWTKATAAFCTLIFLLVIYVFSVKVNLFWLFGKSPSAYDIMHPENPEASEIFTADGQLIGKFFDENRVSVPYDSINPVFFDALISTEDERFYEHFGIDVQGIFAAMKDALSGNARGASTISQQLVKNMFRIRTNYSTGLLGSLPGFSILVKKSKEMIIAVQLEAMNDKKDILQMYANTVDFGSNAYGIKIAAKTYFNTTPSQLKTEEAAVLVGLLKATSTYNPRLHPEKSLERRNVVLDNMCRLGKLSRSACDSLKRLPIKLDYSVESAYDGGVLYFRAPLLEYIREKCPDLDPYTDGLKIYTTLDSKMQRFAEEAVNEQMRSLQDKFVRHWQGVGDPWRDASGRVLPDFIENIARKTSQYKVLAKKFNGVEDSIFKYLEIPHKVHVFDYDGGRDVEMSTMDSIRYMVKFLHTGFVTMEPQTGYVRSYVGDIDFDTWKYDKVQAQRQPGSTFKLFVYAEAMEQGLTPRDTRLDAQVRMEVYDKQKDTTTIWQPHNANGVITYAQLPLRSAFATSVNTIAVNLGQEVGIGNVIKRAKAMGVRSPLREIPSLPLGACDVNLFEMVNAYGTVANDGRQVELPDQWLSNGFVFEVRKPKHAVEVKFYGNSETYLKPDGSYAMRLVNARSIRAVPYDLTVVGYKNGEANLLRLWSAEPSEENLPTDCSFNEYLSTLKELSYGLYPDDSTEHGRLLRLRQQYFLVSAGLQSAINSEIGHYGNLDHFTLFTNLNAKFLT